MRALNSKLLPKLQISSTWVQRKLQASGLRPSTSPTPACPWAGPSMTMVGGRGNSVKDWTLIFLYREGPGFLSQRRRQIYQESALRSARCTLFSYVGNGWIKFSFKLPILPEMLLAGGPLDAQGGNSKFTARFFTKISIMLCFSYVFQGRSVS